MLNLTRPVNPVPAYRGGNSEQCRLLLHGNGPNSSSDILDNSRSKYTVVDTGAVISTAQSKFNGSSIYFSAATGSTGLYISSGLPAIGTADYTIDFWIRRSGSPPFAILDWRPDATEGAYPLLWHSNDNLLYYMDGTNQITGSPLTLNTWQHIAVTRSGSSTRLFLDGTQTGSTYSASSNIQTAAARPVVGFSGHTAYSLPFPGYIDELRIIIGQAVWTANFTPPSVPYW